MVPVLEPDLHLPGAESWDFPRESLPVRSIRVWLLRKLAHQESCLLVGEPRNRQLRACHCYLPALPT